MARITVEDCLKRVDNRFELVNAAAKRVRQIREGSEYLVVSPKNEDIVVALREIAAGRVMMQHELEALAAMIETADTEEEAGVAEEAESEEKEEAAPQEEADAQEAGEETAGEADE